MSSGSENTIAVPAINFRQYLGATGVRFINLGQASKIQPNNEWDSEETIPQLVQKFTTDLETLAGEATNDEKLLKTLVYIERRTFDQIPEEYREHKKHLSTRFGVVFYDDKKNFPQALRRTIITLLHKEHTEINKMSAAAKPFWWPKLTKEMQNKCDECIPCNLAGKSIKTQSPMSEINYLPPADKLNQEIQLDFIGPIRFKQRRLFILVSMTGGMYMRGTSRKNCKNFSGTIFFTKWQNCIPQTIRTEKGTAFTGNEFRSTCKKRSIKLIYGTLYIHTATGLVERGIKTLKDLMRTNLEDKCTVSEELSRSLTVMRTTVHSSIKETPFEGTAEKYRERK